MLLSSSSPPSLLFSLAIFFLSHLTCDVFLMLLSFSLLVLVMAGTLKRAHSDLPEELVLIRALRDSNIPKFLAEDVPLFLAIIQDLFPGVEIPPNNYGILQSAIEDELERQELEVVPSLVTKVIQLYETMIVRHGVMMVGAAATGKSTCYKTLANTLTKLKNDSTSTHRGEPLNPNFDMVKMYVINPKSVTMGQLYGEFNSVTHEWTDGLISNVARKVLSNDSTQKLWIVFDGPVDTLWIENLNTVLDDNKMLCLANGKRIKLQQTVSIVFEVENLAKASPATVSRCGMVFLESVHLGWAPVVRSFLKKIGKVVPIKTDRLIPIAEDLVGTTLTFLKVNCKDDFPCVEINLVNSMLKLFQSLLTFQLEELNSHLEFHSLVDMYLAFAYIWSLGGHLNDRSRLLFNDHARNALMKFLPNFPKDLTVYDYCVSLEQPGFVPWETKVPKFVFTPEIPFHTLVVPTVDTVRLEYLLDVLVHGGHSVVVTGGTGVGKTITIQNMLTKLHHDKFTKVQVGFSARTTAGFLQDIFETKLEKKRNNLLGAVTGKRVVCFIDELNMPQPDEYGSQPPLELLRQCIDNGGFYDLKKLFFKKVVDTQFIAVCGTPEGGGRPAVSSRLLRHFNVINVPTQSKESMEAIFRTVMDGFMSAIQSTQSLLDAYSGDEPFSDEGESQSEEEGAHAIPKPAKSPPPPKMEYLALSQSIVAASVEVYQSILAALLPTPSKSHYIFNLRDLSRLFQGILQVKTIQLERETLISLWCHETARVFRDRLADVSDRQWFNKLIEDMLKKHFQVEWKPETFEVRSQLYHHRTPNIHANTCTPTYPPYYYPDSTNQVTHTHTTYDHILHNHYITQTLAHILTKQYIISNRASYLETTWNVMTQATYKSQETFTY